MKYIKNDQCYRWSDGQGNHHFAKMLDADHQHPNEGHMVEYIHLMVHPNGYPDGCFLDTDCIPVEQFTYDSLIPEELFNEIYQELLKYTHSTPINEEIYRL